jgi:hypothetical protein
MFSETLGFPRISQSYMPEDSALRSTAVRTLNQVSYKDVVFRILFKRGSRTAPQGSQMQQGASLYYLAWLSPIYDMQIAENYKKKKTPWPLVHKRTIPTERPPLVGEVSANFCG